MYILSLNHTWIITKALRGHADLLYVNSIPPPRQGGTPPILRGERGLRISLKNPTEHPIDYWADIQR